MMSADGKRPITLSDSVQIDIAQAIKVDAMIDIQHNSIPLVPPIDVPAGAQVWMNAEHIRITINGKLLALYRRDGDTYIKVKQLVIESGTNDLLWCEEHGRYEQFSTMTIDGVLTEQVSHRPVPINPVIGLP